MPAKIRPLAPYISLEFPPNPNLLNFHVKQELTMEMSERFDANCSDDLLSKTYPWMRKVLSLQGIENIALMRHHVRFRKHKEYQWSVLLPDIQDIFQQYQNPLHYLQLETREDLRRDFTAHAPYPVVGRLVFEGTHQASTHDLAKKLFSFQGLTTAILTEHMVTLKRSPAYTWDELLPDIEKHLSSFSFDGPDQDI